MRVFDWKELNFIPRGDVSQSKSNHEEKLIIGSVSGEKCSSEACMAFWKAHIFTSVGWMHGGQPHRRSLLSMIKADIRRYRQIISYEGSKD